MTTDARLLYMTAASHEEAVDICTTLVSEHLVACANILGPMTSIYRWQGDIQRDSEVAVVLKTRESLVDAASERANQLHSYDCPCIVAIPISGGHSAFLDWIMDETMGN